MTSSWSRSFGTASVSAMQVYGDVLVPGLFVPWARLLLDELALHPGEVVLDLACGPGSLTMLAAERVAAGGRVSGVDLSPAMLELAREKPTPDDAPPIEYQEASADDLPFADGSFDVATCQQGLQFFPERLTALRELHRVLRPGGRVGVAVWSEITDSPVFAALHEALGEVVGEELAHRYRAGPWGMPSEDELAELLAAAGFGEVRIERRTVPVVFQGGAARFLSTLAASGIASEIDALEPGRKAELLDVFAARSAPLTVDGAIHSPTVSNVAVARR